MGLFNRLIYGNPNKQDLEVEENQNPIKAFFDVLKLKIWELCKLNFLFALFVIPLAAWIGVNLSILNTENITVEMVDSTMFMFFIGLIPCLVILGIALPSLSYITKSYAKEFHVWMMEDYGEKIKENWKQSLLYMFVLGVVIFVFYFGIRAYGVLGDQIPAAPVFRSLLYVMAGIVLLSTTFALPLMVTFELNFKHLIRNSMLLTIGKLPQTLLIIVITMIFPALFLWMTFTWNYGFLVLIAYYLIIGFSLPAFIINAFTNQVFEKMIIASGNKEAEVKPEIEHKEVKY